MKSESLKNLAAAFAKAQAAFVAVEKTKLNPFYSSRYADLESVWSAVKGPLHDNGLSVMQRTGYENGVFGVITTLLHVSGEFIEGFYMIAPAKQNDPQSLLACITYGRRGALSALLGVVTDEDTDGEAAMARQPEIRPQAQNPANKPATANSGGFTTISDKQSRFLYAKWKSANIPDAEVKEFCKENWGTEDTRKLPPEAMDPILEWIESQAVGA